MSFRAKRGNLRHHVSHTVAPINIVHPGFSMLIYISAHLTAAVEIATAFGLAMTVEDDSWSRFAGGAAIFPNRTAERHGGRSLRYEFHTPSGHWPQKNAPVPFGTGAQTVKKAKPPL